ncbi:PDZ domain-containing protein [Streptomyces sp. NBC_00386]|jgi:membrane-associated protease RseP (regulator of RpoE activity)|uniref:PDZ domain-containing protein n=1 Tax=Streptomyces sp. NBC_00386 TaxID=2975734 RepID=UPI002E1D155A
MEQTALRPKPMPGGDPGGGTRPSGSTRPSGGARRPHAARRRGRRLITVVAGVSAGVVLVLSGVGLGAVGATVIGVSRPADLQRQTGAAGQPRQPSAASEAPKPGDTGAPRPGRSGAPRAGGVTAESGGGPVRPGESEQRSVRGTLGVEAVDAPGGAGALVVGVHLPGPGYSAGLVRGDTLLALDGTGITSAADLARAVADAAPGVEVTLRVRHANGSRGQLSAVPGTAT